MTILDFDEFSEMFRQAGFEITEDCYAMLDKYAAMLTEYNKVMNLTGITDPLGISEKHFLDSLLVFKYCKIPFGSKIIDVGTGAGFPGVPIKMYRPDIELTLLDSLGKRVNFLKDVSRETSLNFKCVHARAEEGGHDKSLRESFDFACARAVAALPVLAEYCIPFVKPGGSFIAMKGPGEDFSQGENAIRLLGGEIEDMISYDLPCGDKRVIVSVKKISATPTKYPRSSARISKKHL